MAEDFVVFWSEEANKMLSESILFSSDSGKNNVVYDFIRDKNTSSNLKEFKIKAIIYPAFFNQFDCLLPSNNKIAQELFLSLSTVKSHVSHIFRKSPLLSARKRLFINTKKRSYL